MSDWRGREGKEVGHGPSWAGIGWTRGSAGLKGEVKSAKTEGIYMFATWGWYTGYGPSLLLLLVCLCVGWWGGWCLVVGLTIKFWRGECWARWRLRKNVYERWTSEVLKKELVVTVFVNEAAVSYGVFCRGLWTRHGLALTLWPMGQTTKWW